MNIFNIYLLDPSRQIEWKDCLFKTLKVGIESDFQKVIQIQLKI